MQLMIDEKIHARLGEVSLMAANVAAEGPTQKHLAESLKRFCRSIELCEDYLRGYYGLKKVSTMCDMIFVFGR